MLTAGELSRDTKAPKGEERDEQQQRHPGGWSAAQPPVPALGGIFTLDTVPSQAFADLASMRCG